MIHYCFILPNRVVHYILNFNGASVYKNQREAQIRLPQHDSAKPLRAHPGRFLHLQRGLVPPIMGRDIREAGEGGGV